MVVLVKDRVPNGDWCKKISEDKMKELERYKEDNILNLGGR